DGLQHVQDLDAARVGFQDGPEAAVHRRRLVGAAAPELDAPAGQIPADRIHVDDPAHPHPPPALPAPLAGSLGAGEDPPSAVDGGVERGPGLLRIHTPQDDGDVAHAPADEGELARPVGGGPFADYDHLLAVYFLPPGEVVVVVHLQ